MDSAQEVWPPGGGLESPSVPHPAARRHQSAHFQAPSSPRAGPGGELIIPPRQKNGAASKREQKQRRAPMFPKTPLEAMRHRLATPEGQQTYALRKQTPEPVFGIIKSVMGFRQFSLRGLDKVKGEWNLVTLAWNVKRMFALQPA